MDFIADFLFIFMLRTYRLTGAIVVFIQTDILRMVPIIAITTRMISCGDMLTKYGN
jgi:hypothetical protein